MQKLHARTNYVLVSVDNIKGKHMMSLNIHCATFSILDWSIYVPTTPPDFACFFVASLLCSPPAVEEKSFFTFVSISIWKFNSLLFRLIDIRCTR